MILLLRFVVPAVLLLAVTTTADAARLLAPVIETEINDRQLQGTLEERCEVIEDPAADNCECEGDPNGIHHLVCTYSESCISPGGAIGTRRLVRDYDGSLLMNVQSCLTYTRDPSRATTCWTVATDFAATDDNCVITVNGEECSACRRLVCDPNALFGQQGYEVECSGHSYVGADRPMFNTCVDDLSGTVFAFLDLNDGSCDDFQPLPLPFDEPPPLPPQGLSPPADTAPSPPASDANKTIQSVSFIVGIFKFVSVIATMVAMM